MEGGGGVGGGVSVDGPNSNNLIIFVMYMLSEGISHNCF